MTRYAPITLKLHATIDFLALTFVLVSPWLLGFSEYTGAAVFCAALFFVGMGLNVITDYPLGALKLLPFRWHQAIELISPVVFIGVPWYFFSGAGAMPWAISVVGLLVVLNAALTKPIQARD